MILPGAGLKNVAADHNKWFYPAVVLAALLLLIPAFYNHYPLVNPDTATFLASGFIPETPFDRPITYGLLIRLFSLNGLSLWCLVFMQAYIVSWLLFKICKNIAANNTYILKALFIAIVLSTCTSLSWIVSQVQPDVFTPIAFLCIILIVMNKEGIKDKVILYILFFIAVATHLSHPALFITTLLFLLMLTKWSMPGNMYWQAGKKIAVLVVLSAASIVVMGSALAKSKHVFFTGSLLEKGVLKQYLNDKCATENYKLCAYKDSLPENLDYFLWDPGSPIYKIGDWKGTKDEFNSIIHGILTDPVYLKLFIAAAAKQTVKQAATFNIGDGNTSFPPGSNVNMRVSKYFPGEIKDFNEAKQNKTSLRNLLAVPNTFFVAAVILSLVVFLFILFRWKRLSHEIKLVFIICGAGILLNCIDCAFFGTVNGRFGCKMIWLLPFCDLLFFVLANRRMQIPSKT